MDEWLQPKPEVVVTGKLTDHCLHLKGQKAACVEKYSGLLKVLC